MESYVFFTETDFEGVVEHTIVAEDAGIAHLILLDSGYTVEEITFAGCKNKND